MNTRRHRRILIILGTDHHPFVRLCDWADEWVSQHPGDEVVVQCGSTRPPSRAVGIEMFTPQCLVEELNNVDAAITHGGPGSIATVRASGLRPIIVPRNPRLGEHVDDHQMRFSAWAATHDLGDVVSDLAELGRSLERQLALGRIEQVDHRVDETVARVGQVFHALHAGARGHARIPVRRRVRNTRTHLSRAG